MKKIKENFGGAVVLILALAVVAVFWFASSYSQSVDEDRRFNVSAEGEVVAVPDVAQFTFTVITEGGTDLGTLQDENTNKMNNAISFVKDQGVEDKDIKTSGYNISPRYQRYDCPVELRESGEPCPPPEIVGYSISQDVQVKIRDFSNIGPILSGVVDEGANSVSGLSFTIDDDSEVRAEARAQAIEKAREKAESIADQAGFRLGDIVSVNENIVSPYRSYRVVEDAFGAGDAAMESAPSVEPGSQEVRVNVNITYEIN